MTLKNKKEKISMDDLALMIGKGFEHVDQRLDAMDKRMCSMDQRFDKMDERFDKMDGKLDDMDRSNNQAHENAGLRLNEMAYRFELTDLKKRVEILEKRAIRHN